MYAMANAANGAADGPHAARAALGAAARTEEGMMAKETCRTVDMKKKMGSMMRLRPMPEMKMEAHKIAPKEVKGKVQRP